MLLEVENLCLSYDKKVLYSNASFKIFENEKIGIVGDNGVGKSTLIQILGNKVIPDSGTVTFDKNIKVGYLDQYLKIDKKITIIEYLKSAFKKQYELNEKMNSFLNATQGVTDEEELNSLINKASNCREQLERDGFYALDSVIARIATGLGINKYGINTEMGKLSGGQKVKVILAKLLLENPNLIILDEPTNFLDTVHVDWLVKYLKEFKGAFLIVSHNQEFLDNVVNRILDIGYGKVTKYKGNYQEYLVKKAMMLENYEREYDANIKERSRLEDYIKKNKTRASTANMAKSRQKKLDKMDVLEKPKTGSTKMHMTFNYKPIASHKFLEVENLEIGYYFSLLPPISFQVKSGEKIAITGFNGIGKSTLLKTLIGELSPMEGHYKFVDDALIAYYEQDLNWENDTITPMQLISNIYPKMTERDIRSELAKCGLTANLSVQPIKTLSGGEQSKLKLCEVMLIKANILILDEPTNHMDAVSKESLLDCLKKYQGTVIFVSHERSFIEKLATRVINIEDLLTA